MPTNYQDKTIKINGIKCKVDFSIRTKFASEVVDYLKQNKIAYQVLETETFIEDPEDTIKEQAYVPIAKDLYDKLVRVCEITGIPLEQIINAEIGTLLNDHAREDPIYFLENFLGIENVKDPIAIARKLQPILNIPESWIKNLEQVDPVQYIKKIKNIF